MKKQIDDRCFFDTNVLLYAFGAEDFRTDAARRLMAGGGIIGVQILNEFVAVARRKLRMAWREINEALIAIRVFCPAPVPLGIGTHESGVRIAERHGYGIFDALVIAAAIEASCTILYSEDMHDGQMIEGVTIRNPFLRRAP